MSVSGRKYGNTFCERDGYTFASLAERAEYDQLRLRELAGEIIDLAVHPTFTIVVNDVKVCTYVADFRHREVATGERVVTDVKGKKTRVYSLKRKLMLAVWGIKIREVLP